MRRTCFWMRRDVLFTRGREPTSVAPISMCPERSLVTPRNTLCVDHPFLLSSSVKSSTEDLRRSCPITSAFFTTTDLPCVIPFRPHGLIQPRSTPVGRERNRIPGSGPSISSRTQRLVEELDAVRGLHIDVFSGRDDLFGPFPREDHNEFPTVVLVGEDDGFPSHMRRDGRRAGA